MIEFLPSNRDVLDAFTHRIEHDNLYVLKCLVECGLDESILNLKYVQASEYIIQDFRNFFNAHMKMDTFDVTDTFKSFVDEHGRYSRIIHAGPITESLTVHLDTTNKGFKVFKYSSLSSPEQKVNEYSQETFNENGIEMKRNLRCYITYSDGNHKETSEISTRQEDMVTYITATYDEDGKVIDQKRFAVSPNYDEARTLNAYLNVSEFPPEILATIIKEIQQSTELSAIHSKNINNKDSIEEAVDLSTNDSELNIDNDNDGIEIE